MSDTVFTLSILTGSCLFIVLSMLTWRVYSLRRELDTFRALYQSGISQRQQMGQDLAELRSGLRLLERQVGPQDMRAMSQMSVLDRIADLIGWVHKMDTRLERHDLAAGGFWKTTGGDVLRLRDVSDGHLRNLMQGGFGSPRMKEQFRQEQRRRELDRDMSAAGDRIQTLPEPERIRVLRKLVRPRPDMEGEDIFNTTQQVDHLFHGDGEL